jgi:hypothetical protein
MTRGSRALLTVVLVTALVLTPLILGGVYLGYYVGGEVGYSKSILAIAFSTLGFIVGMGVIFQVIRMVVGKPSATA